MNTELLDKEIASNIFCIRGEEQLRLFNIWGQQHNYNPDVSIQSLVKPYFPYKKVTRVIYR